MTKGFILVACILIWSIFMASTSATAAEPVKMIELILDASGSMNGKLKSGETKIEAAKKAVSGLAQKLHGDMNVAFRAYGHQSAREKHDCQDTEIIYQFQKIGGYRDKISGRMKNIYARGYTPITFVIQKAAEDFPAQFQGDKVIILVSDGKETCQGDPCAVAMSLKKSKAKLVIHTIGFGVDEATKQQLECIARSTGGKYFSAADTAQLADVLNRAAETAGIDVSMKKGDGWLEVKGADLSGHTVTNAETGTEAGILSHTNSSMKLPAGIYNVTVGKAVWKSIEVKAGEKTVLNPGFLKVENASLKGHEVIDKETGTEHGSVSRLKNIIALMPGEYDVMFGKLPWDVTISAGETMVLKPGTVEVEHAHYMGHKIRNAQGEVVGEVSNIMNWIPLPPGNYSIEIGGKKHRFTLKEGEDVKFRNK